MLYRCGYRFRVCVPLPFDGRRRADITFTKVGLHVFIDGCFWHGCPEHFTLPKTNTDFWRDKIEGNRRRDEDTTERLQQLGFTVLRFWEHESPNEVTSRVIRGYEALHGDARTDEA